jgi:hypothetical protein
MYSIHTFIFFGIPNFSDSEFQFLIFLTAEFEKNFPTGIFGIENGIGIPLAMGVPEIGTENWNSQPSTVDDESKDKSNNIHFFRTMMMWSFH